MKPRLRHASSVSTPHENRIGRDQHVWSSCAITARTAEGRKDASGLSCTPALAPLAQRPHTPWRHGAEGTENAFWYRTTDLDELRAVECFWVAYLPRGQGHEPEHERQAHGVEHPLCRHFLARVKRHPVDRGPVTRFLGWIRVWISRVVGRRTARTLTRLFIV